MLHTILVYNCIILTSWECLHGLLGKSQSLMVGRLKRVILTPTQRSRNLFFISKKSVTLKRLGPYYTERAYLPSYLIKFTLSGEGLLTYKDNQHQLKAGDLFY